MIIPPLTTQRKFDSPEKLEYIEANNIPSRYLISASEYNSLVAKINQLIFAQNYIVFDTWFTMDGLQVEIIDNSLNLMGSTYPDLHLQQFPGYSEFRTIVFMAGPSPIILPNYTAITYPAVREGGVLFDAPEVFLADQTGDGLIRFVTRENHFITPTMERMRHRVDFYTQSKL